MATVAATLFFAWLGIQKGQEINLTISLASFIFSLIYVPLVIIKLPVFNKYFVKNSNEINPIHHNRANYKTAPVSVGIVAGFTLAIVLYALKAPHIAFHSFLGAVAATGISFYYEPKF